MTVFNSRETLTEQIARHLSQQIIIGHYAPGQKLRELAIARELDVSSNTVREAFHLVEKRHLLSIEPRRGAFVAVITPQQVSALYDFVFLLFAELARRAATHWQQRDMEDFLAILQHMEKNLAAQDVGGFHATAFGFVHRALQFAGNPYLEQALGDLLPELQRCSYIALRAETSEIALSYDLFRKLIDSMLVRDAGAAAEAARRYGDNQARIVLKAIATARRTSPS